jgi:hypothetical protein
MRGQQERSGSLFSYFSYVSIKERIPASYRRADSKSQLVLCCG